MSTVSRITKFMKVYYTSLFNPLIPGGNTYLNKPAPKSIKFI